MKKIILSFIVVANIFFLISFIRAEGREEKVIFTDVGPINTIEESIRNKSKVRTVTENRGLKGLSKEDYTRYRDSLILKEEKGALPVNEMMDLIEIYNYELRK